LLLLLGIDKTHLWCALEKLQYVIRRKIEHLAPIVD
jgi:hypothetical protein